MTAIRFLLIEVIQSFLLKLAIKKLQKKYNNKKKKKEIHKTFEELVNFKREYKFYKLIEKIDSKKNQLCKKDFFLIKISKKNMFLLDKIRTYEWYMNGRVCDFFKERKTNKELSENVFILLEKLDFTYNENVLRFFKIDDRVKKVRTNPFRFEKIDIYFENPKSFYKDYYFVNRILKKQKNKNLKCSCLEE